ncbi:ABC-type transport auxiliary lipoprotein family protein [Uliginosibacterium sp. H1]|uniref:ABC-type transport auxiliary lipoprotein family protein n=1 Tax=Uliginosibacterium sp. H1 TaxID=3114757 RepID=UPI002E199037|nr:ABC-type transport auxiliary lipoprotein family protein [Uliginosibacterium sp. H1]
MTTPDTYSLSSPAATAGLRASARGVLLALSLAVAGCGSLQPAPVVTQHDLGGLFDVGGTRSPVPLRTLNVTAQPLVSGTGMQYREVAQPTRRAVYAQNRWAAPPAAMVEPALLRLLAVDGGGSCRLQLSLAEFIIEVDAQGQSRARIAADLRLLDARGVNAQMHSLDVSEPLARTAPAEGAQAMRRAVQRLGDGVAAWLAGDAGRACKT